jgi:predicted phage-related endonuclease
MPTPINISASRGAAIIGLSKWSTPINVWLQIMESREPGFCEKNNYTYPVFEESAALRWGNAFEDAIVELAENIRDTRISWREKQYEARIHNDIYHRFITCHIDGKYVSTENILHEGKTTSAFYYRDNFGEPGTDKVPIEYQIQTQHQMICTGAEKVILSVLVFPRRVEEWEEMGIELDPEKDIRYMKIPNKTLYQPKKTWAWVLAEMGYFHQYEIKANPELQKLMIEHYTDFWNNHVLAGKPPRPQSYDDIKSLVKNPVGTIVADSNISSLAREYKDIKKEIGSSGDLSKRCDFLKTKILDYMRKSNIASELPIDDDSVDKWILRDEQGKKLFSFNGKVMR